MVNLSPSCPASGSTASSDIDGKTEVAGYSITSSPTEDGWFSIAVKLVGDSAVTDYLHDSAAVGDSLIVEGGQGDFHYAGNDSHPLAFIAGGIGITPIASIIRYIDNSALKVPATLVYSASTPSELLFCEEFKAIEARNPPFPRPLQRNPPPQRTLERSHRKNKRHYPARRRNRRQHLLLPMRPPQK